MIDYGYVLVFFGSLVEGDATLMTAAFLSHQGHLSFLGVLATAALASTLLNETVYHLSRTRSRQYFERKISRTSKVRTSSGLDSQPIRAASVVLSIPLWLSTCHTSGMRRYRDAAIGLFVIERSGRSALGDSARVLRDMLSELQFNAFGMEFERTNGTSHWPRSQLGGRYWFCMIRNCTWSLRCCCEQDSSRSLNHLDYVI